MLATRAGNDNATPGLRAHSGTGAIDDGQVPGLSLAVLLPIVRSLGEGSTWHVRRPLHARSDCARHLAAAYPQAADRPWWSRKNFDRNVIEHPYIGDLRVTLSHRVGSSMSFMR